MKKILLASLLFSGTVLAATAQTRVTVTPVGEIPEQDQPSQRKVMSMASVLADENFDAMTSGTVDEPDYDSLLASFYGDPAIDPSLTHGASWQGHKVYPAGGAIALRTFNPADQASIQTPKGDYSGSVSVTFRAKFLNVEWQDDNGKKSSWGSSILYVGLDNDSDRSFKIKGNAYNQAQITLYKEMGWVDVRVEFDNYSAYNDAYINLYCSSGIIIDDIKVTSSADKFLACPVITGLTDVTETSFTVNYEPVRNAANYYGYLFSLEGYDEDGLPVYQYTFPEAELRELAQSGMSVEDYVASMAGYESYLNSAMTDRQYQTSMTFSDLDPEKEYYFAIASHHLHTFSDYKGAIKPVNVLPTPVVDKASGIKTNEFTANWSPVTKAESYKVNLYGVNRVAEDEENFIIFDEDFGNVTAFTDAKDIKTPEWVGVDNDVTIDDMVSTPGWSSSESEWPLVEGKLGLKWKGAWVATPSLFVANADKLRVSLKLEFPTEVESFIVKFGDDRYLVPVEGGTLFEDEVVIPTGGLESGKLQIACADDYAMFIDYMTISQSLKKGDLTYVWLGSEMQNAPEVSHLFSALDSDSYDMYGYSVHALRGSGRSRISSEESDRAIVDLKNADSFVTGIGQVPENDLQVVETGRYTVDGIRVASPRKGLNIVRYSDGSVRKVVVR